MDRGQVIPHGLPDDPPSADLQDPEHAMAEPAAAAIDAEGTTGQPSRPDVLVDHEVAPVVAPERGVALVDRGRQQFVVAPPDGVEPLDGVIGKADHLVHDPVGHRGQDRLDIAIVFGAELAIHETIEVLLLHHTTHLRRAR